MVYCRGEKRRIEMVEEFDIIPIGRFKLLNGQEIKSCTQNPLIDSYYVFSYKRKNSGTKDKYFECGELAANHFLKLLDIPSIKVKYFNPLKLNIKDTDPSIPHNSNSSNKNELAVQLLNAINLLMMRYQIYGDPIKSIKYNIETNLNNPVYLGDIKSVNTIASKLKPYLTLTEILNELKKDNQSIRTFKFDLLTKALEKDLSIEKIYLR